MTVDEGPNVSVHPAASSVTAPPHVLTGRLVTLRFLVAALRRGRSAWLTLALVGLLAGAGYHLVVPIEYSAATALYLAHDTGAPTTVQVQNDLTILSTGAVGRRAIALLGHDGAGLTPTGLLGKTPATMSGSDILTLRISGPTPQAAVRRVNAVATAYLTFRAQVYESQNSAVVNATNSQLAAVRAHIATLNKQLAALGSQGTSQKVANLKAQLGTATTQVVSLEDAIQAATLNTLSVVHGSRVITPGTVETASRAKVTAFDGLTGLVAGLGVGVIAVIVSFLLSDAIRRREDLAALVGAPVGVSVGRIGNRFTRLRSVLTRTGRWGRPASIVSHYLRGQMERSKPATAHLIVAVDDVRAPAAALRAICMRLRSSAQRVVLVDETAGREFARALRRRGQGLHPVQLGNGTPVTLLLPPMPWEGEPDENWLAVLDDIADADQVLVVATIDPGIGAWHLRRWAPEAILTVTAGVATTHRVAALTELLDAAGISISSAVLFNADPADESVGLPLIDLATGADRFEVVQAAGAPAT